MYVPTYDDIGKTDCSTQTDADQNILAIEQIIQNLKKFISEKPYNEQLSILTVLPDCWSAKKIEDKMGITGHMAKKIKCLQRRNESAPAPRKTRKDTMDPQIITRVKDHYLKDTVTRTFPG